MMAGLALVPAWFWVALGTILALAGLVARVIWSRHTRYHPEHKAGTWARARRVIRSAEFVEESPEQDFYGSMTLAEDYTRHFLTTTPGTRMTIFTDGMVEFTEEPTAAEVSASRVAHGYIPELDPDAPMWQYEAARPETAEQMPWVALPRLGPPEHYQLLAGTEAWLYDGPADTGDVPRCQACAATDCPGIADGVDACPAWREAEARNARGEYLPTYPTRLADTGDVMDAHLAADVAAELRRQNADVAAWLAELDGACRAYRRELAAAL